jgi:hypothetical protein
LRTIPHIPKNCRIKEDFNEICLPTHLNVYALVNVNVSAPLPAAVGCRSNPELFHRARNLHIAANIARLPDLLSR